MVVPLLEIDYKLCKEFARPLINGSLPTIRFRNDGDEDIRHPGAFFQIWPDGRCEIVIAGMTAGNPAAASGYFAHELTHLIQCEREGFETFVRNYTRSIANVPTRDLEEYCFAHHDDELNRQYLSTPYEAEAHEAEVIGAWIGFIRLAEPSIYWSRASMKAAR